MKTTVQTHQTTYGNSIFTNLEIEIEELEEIAAPEPVTKLAVNHNQTLVCDRRTRQPLRKSS